MGEREAAGDFDYLWDDPADVDGLTSDDAVLEVQQAGEPDSPRDDLWDEPGDNFWDNQPDPDDSGRSDGRFDAFNINTWSFKPAPTPWYRTKQALTAIIAASAAVAAIVVSGVLLVFRGPSGTVDEVTSVTPTAPTSAQPVPLATSAAPEPPLPPPPPPPPSPPPETASPVNTAPRYEAPRVQPRPTRRPEINITRSPMSVAPQPRTGHSATR